jgi:excinuclease ABC subunit A
MESLSSYARQFLGQTAKPSVESIEGLSPAISIDQKTTSHNPRSTVGTVTEIYDYMRLLYARVGEAHCPECNKRISRQSVDQIRDQIFKIYGTGQTMTSGEMQGAEISGNMSKDGGQTPQLLTIEAPVIRGQKGTFAKELEQYKRSGYVRARIDGSIYQLDEPINLDKNIRHNISIIVDRLSVTEDEGTRLNEAIENAIRLANGLVTISPKEGESMTFSNNFACLDCGVNIEELEPRSFSFNSPFGACQNCAGLGFTMEIDVDKIIPNRNLKLSEGAIVASGWNMENGKIAQIMLSAFANTFGITLDHRVRDLAPDILHKMLYGCDEPLKYEFSRGAYDFPFQGKYEGVIGNLQRRYKETNSEFMRHEIGRLMVNATCTKCQGRRLRKEALAVRVGGLNINELTSQSVTKILAFFERLKLDVTRTKIAAPIIKEVKARCKFLVDVGLHYLTLARSADTLSGGESQRIRLATQIGSGLVGVLYILDEPSIGLHQRDNAKLLKTLFGLRDLGNTLIVVEHDEETI